VTEVLRVPGFKQVGSEVMQADQAFFMAWRLKSRYRQHVNDNFFTAFLAAMSLWSGTFSERLIPKRKNVVSC